MHNLVLFAGTTEGRLVAEGCRNQPVALTVCVATAYGEAVLEQAENLRILTGRKTAAEMAKVLRQAQAELVIDATHPYAAKVTGEIQTACRETGTEYLRLTRAAAEGDGWAEVDSAAAAAQYLCTVPGRVLLTVGSQELAQFTSIPAFQDRLYARILPLQGSLETAAALGFAGSHLICMQGPFSKELNVALLHMLDIRWLVTKDTGAAGGFAEKQQAAQEAGAQLLVIRRPSAETGVTLPACLRLLRERFGVAEKKQISVVGIGMGSPETMTAAAEQVCQAAELFIGAKRMTDSLARFGKPAVEAILPKEIAAAVAESDKSRIVVAMSGDTGFFSGTKKLLPQLKQWQTQVLPGISSVSYLCSRLGISWDDACLVSAHGRELNLVGKVKRHPKVIALAGGADGTAAALAALVDNGLGQVRVTVGENLAYESETITAGTAAELRDRAFSSLSLLLVENPAPAAVVTGGLPDGAFLRTEVPMTKQEVRAVILSKLALTGDAVCYDVGAGTGSVSLEMAICAEAGQVYAVERNGEACALIAQNKRHLGVTNVTVVPGAAPEALAGLPAPTHAFIGGSGGALAAVVSCLLAKNPAVRIVMTAVTAESFAAAVSCFRAAPVQDLEITQVSVARGRRAGPYHLMTAQNPVTIFSCTGGGKDG